MASTDAISQLAASTQSSATNAAIGKSASQLNVNDFMTLMTAQLKNQDPLNPLQSTEFVAQLAQFGTVSGIQNMQSTLTSLSDSLRSSQVLSGASLVGRQVTAPSSTAALGDTGSVNGSVSVPTGASSLAIAINDASGQVVRTIAVPTTDATESFSWDGITDSGARAPAGTYTLDAVANVGGTGQSADVLMSGKVASVTMSADGNTLSLNTDSMGSIKLADVRSVM